MTSVWLCSTQSSSASSGIGCAALALTLAITVAHAILERDCAFAHVISAGQTSSIAPLPSGACTSLSDQHCAQNPRRAL